MKRYQMISPVTRLSSSQDNERKTISML